jgi:glycosyltransferase involved in cell wall biosynthesis
MQIHFVRGGDSYLPELDAYGEHVARFGWTTQVHSDAGTVPADARAVWWICGRVPSTEARGLAHAFHVPEYASASVPPYASLKDAVKRWTHPRPHHRVFQSEWVRKRMGFHSSVPYSLRDMGVPRSFFDAHAESPPEFDLVYVGETSRLAGFLPALAALLEARLSLLVVGSVAPELGALLSRFANVRCIGRVPQAQVPAQLLRARAGLNLMPPRLPFTEQTSTKVLEYLATGLPVISSDYGWARRTAEEHRGRIRLVRNFDAGAWKAALDGVAPVEEDRSALRHLTWEARLEGLPVWQALQQWERTA